MNVQCQRLFGARKALSRIYKRHITTEQFVAQFNKNRDSLTPLSNDEAVTGEHETKLKTDSSSTDSQEESPVHWALGKGYEVGGKLERSQNTLVSFDQGTGVPHWDHRRISIRIRRFEGEIPMSMAHIWLRDNCRCAQCVNQDTMQRTLDTFSIPPKIQPREVVTEKEGLRVTWANDGHVSLYPWDTLLKFRRTHQVGIPNRSAKSKADNRLNYWGSEIESDPPSVHYDEIMADDKGVGKWTAKIRSYGFSYVEGCPVSPEKTQELLERIAFIRQTHYGGFYDFTADLTMKDTAYTNLALPAHTDTTYFTDPVGLQMFHLLSHEQGEGGASLLVDGFKASKILSKQHRGAYQFLANTPITWHASGNEGITITPGQRFPVLSIGPEADKIPDKPIQIRWNNDDRGMDYMLDGQYTELWYEAAREWQNILKRKDLQYWAQLKPGRPLIFDNWRVLHGRSAFTGKRRMCGGYINHDDYISRWRNTNFTREEALAQILG